MTDDLIPLEPEEGVDRFLSHRGPKWRDATYDNAVHRMGVFLDWCEEQGVDDLNALTGRDLSDFVAWRRDDVAPITLQKQLSTVRVFLRWAANTDAVRDGLAEKLQAPELPDGAESSDVVIEPERVKEILAYLDRHDYASRQHAMVALLWRTGMRRGALHSLDVDDLRPEDDAIVLRHRPDQGTKLKNGSDGERWVYLGPRWYQIVADYVSDRRVEITDEHGREPLLTTRYGRIAKTTITDNCYRVSRPCGLSGECPVSRDIEECEGTRDPGHCPVKRGPHAFRRSAISEHLRLGTDPDVVSERMNVSLKVLYRHYDVRTNREKMSVRKDQIPRQS
ncbi:tyrosine-type recombinase/integrase [Halorubrum sp. HHNYT27]|uniref:tyrosine-type recombinase/integrase n=1 Tax=Halorubrum sp. HHNYT27 TaxID=3402275 RepID=UPI003EBBB176